MASGRNKKKRKAAEKKAKKKEKEVEKLSGKFEKYENETQASAIMTTLFMIFISLSQWLLSTYFKWDKIGLETLIEKIFRLPGRYGMCTPVLRELFILIVRIRTEISMNKSSIA